MYLRFSVFCKIQYRTGQKFCKSYSVFPKLGTLDFLYCFPPGSHDRQICPFFLISIINAEKICRICSK